ncbi:MAG TPA: aminotransferase [Polyangiaceae bacterium]|nr:aminotransferase [Polyangiaceae bacterium]
MHPLYAQLPTTIFEVMSGLARELGAVNLGQGFPEEDGPLFVREAAARALLEQSNQYPPLRGLPELRQAVAGHYAAQQGVSLDPDQEIVVTSGGTEGLAASLLALIAPGDEVLVFEPLYDAYVPLIQRAGGVVRVGRLQAPEFRLQASELERLFSEKTRLVVINTPGNPNARAFELDELELLADYVERFDCRVVSDEVWEQVVFDGRRHVGVLQVPRLRERAVKIGSAGKMFSLTGWKVGFVCAAPPLARCVAAAHQFLTFTTPPNLQRAVAHGLTSPGVYFDELVAQLQASRDRLTRGLAQEGFVTLPSQATYFATLDLAASGIALDDADFCFRAVREAGVAVLPLSAFYVDAAPRHFVRLCFSKKPETLDRGIEGLARMRRLLG